MLANPGRRWWVNPLPARLPRQLRSVSSGVVRLSNEYCGKGWRRRSSLHPRSQGYEDRRRRGMKVVGSRTDWDSAEANSSVSSM